MELSIIYIRKETLQSKACMKRKMENEKKNAKLRLIVIDLLTESNSRGKKKV